MNRSISITDPDGDAVELSLAKEGVCVTATTHDTSPAGGDQLTVGPFELSNLRAALDGFAPVQVSHHADALTFDQARSLIEERDQAVTDRDQAVEALDNTLGRAIKAERELNELRTQLEADSDVNYLLREDRDAWRRKAEQTRSLTADQVPDVMVLPMLEALGCREKGKRVAQHSALIVSHIRDGLAAALAVDTSRPEGAEELDPFVDRLIRGCSDITSPETVRHIADGLANEGVRAPEVGR